MKLSKSSWHYWIYSKYFRDEPTNLCPYFWKALSCTLFVIPLCILYLPIWLVCKMFRQDPYDEPFDGAGIGLILAVYFGIGILICMIAMWFTKNEAIDIFGYMGYGIIAIFGLCYVFHRGGKSRPASLVSSYFKAKKDKYCPRIEWEEKK